MDRICYNYKAMLANPSYVYARGGLCHDISYNYKAMLANPVTLPMSRPCLIATIAIGLQLASAVFRR